MWLLALLAAMAGPAAARHRNGAAFVSQLPPPSSMVGGSTATVSITFRNTGTAAWTASGGYKLGAQEPSDNTLWRRGRIALSPGETIRPGASKTFRFEVTAPRTAGRHVFRWRLVQERVQWFGHSSPAVTVQVSVSSGPAWCVNGRVDARAYFFSVIGRSEGASAADWVEVLRRSGLPAGPRPGVRPAPNAPFFGITQQIDSSGNLRGRIFLPTDTPDAYGYYIRGIDVLSSAPHRWTWNDWLGGPAYAARSCP
ncbi:MAG: hypothetical protein HY553_08625 [Elusimicrobia bacterium]|nr:hypothetical protein [Elusimicrobiota bacterium]